MTEGKGSLLRRADQTGIPLLLARVLLGALFIYMGLKKVADPIDFLKLMRQYKMLPAGYWMNSAALILPWIETLCGTALLLGVAVRGAGLILAGMLAAFTPLVLTRGLELYQAAEGSLTFCQVSFDCGCGAGVVLLCAKLAENVASFLLALIAVTSRSRRFCLSRLLLRRTARRIPSETARYGDAGVCRSDALS